jgi:hypothetical protein
MVSLSNHAGGRSRALSSLPGLSRQSILPQAWTTGTSPVVTMVGDVEE